MSQAIRTSGDNRQSGHRLLPSSGHVLVGRDRLLVIWSDVGCISPFLFAFIVCLRRDFAHFGEPQILPQSLGYTGAQLHRLVEEIPDFIDLHLFRKGPSPALL